MPPRSCVRIDRHLDGLRHVEIGMRGNVLAMAAAIVLPAMIKAGDVIAAHETEAQLHAAVRTAVFPDMRDAAGVAPYHQFPGQQPRAGRASGLERMRQIRPDASCLRNSCPSPLRRQTGAASHIQNKALGTDQGCTPSRTHRRGRSRRGPSGDGLVADAADIDRKIEPRRRAVTRKLNENIRCATFR